MIFNGYNHLVLCCFHAVDHENPEARKAGIDLNPPGSPAGALLDLSGSSLTPEIWSSR